MSKPIHKSFIANFAYIILICIGLYWLFFASLGWLTGHGEEMTVPKVSGKQLGEVVDLLKKEGFEIDIDSTYDPDKDPLIVLDQQPEGGSTVKIGRTIFLIVNKQSPPGTPMPNLVNLSYRSAVMLLKSNKLVLGDTTLRPDVAQGAVLEQLFDGNPIVAGTMIPQGSRVDLVVGDGLGNKEISVPELIGVTYPEAVAILSSSNLQYTVIFDGTINDTATAVVYAQAPLPFNEFSEPNRILEGEYVDFRVRQSNENEE